MVVHVTNLATRNGHRNYLCLTGGKGGYQYKEQRWRATFGFSRRWKDQTVYD